MVISSVGPKPGKERLFEMLLDSQDIAGNDWKRIKEHSYRTGAGKRKPMEIRRARKLGSTTVWRCLRSDVERRSLWLSVFPFASSEDAQLYLPKLLEHVVRPPGSKFVITEKRVVEDTPMTGLPNALVYEEQFTGPDGLGLSRLVAGTAGEYLFVMNFTGLGQPWPWEDVSPIVASQAERIEATEPKRPTS
jgi:hypothetical protein